MRLVTLLSLIAFVCSAPLSEQNVDQELQNDENKVILVKRAKEFMMYGNQQNEATDKEKRSDPSEIQNNIDEQGEVVAEEPVQLEQAEQPAQQSDDTPEQEAPANEDLPTDTNMAVDAPMTSDEEVGSEEGDQQRVDESEEVDSNPDEVSQEEDVQNVENEADDSNELELYDKYLQSYEKGDKNGYLTDLFNNKYSRWEPSYPSPYNLYDYLTAGRYRRSQARRLQKAFPRSRVLKRARRIKRDLYFASDILGKNYNPYEDAYLESPYETEVEDLDEDDIRYLVNLLENAEEYENEAPGYDEELLPAYPGYLGPELDSDDSEYYIPKRQAGLTFVPGLKRSGDFYPYFEEPGAHFSAFVPQKRSMDDYALAYKRLMELAGELRPETYYPSEYEFGEEIFTSMAFPSLTRIFLPFQNRS